MRWKNWKGLERFCSGVWCFWCFATWDHKQKKFPADKEKGWLDGPTVYVAIVFFYSDLTMVPKPTSSKCSASWEDSGRRGDQFNIADSYQHQSWMTMFVLIAAASTLAMMLGQ